MDENLLDLKINPHQPREGDVDSQTQTNDPILSSNII